MKCRYVGGDIKKYLEECFIRYEGVPYYASVDGQSVHLVDLETRSTVKVVRGDDPLLDISSITLGWVNINKYFAVHIKRQPYRRWKQGVAFSNITIFKLANKDEHEEVSKNSLLNREFKNSILGIYPSYEDAFRLVTTKKRVSVAISNTIAVKRVASTLEFYFDEEKFGEMSLEEKGVVKVKKNDYSWVGIIELSKIKGLEIKEVSDV